MKSSEEPGRATFNDHPADPAGHAVTEKETIQLQPGVSTKTIRNTKGLLGKIQDKERFWLLLTVFSEDL